jgi:type I restriction-modification system DNA methylase subunit
MMGKERICVQLGVSLATINNWIKTQVIPPPDNQNCYTEETMINIVNKIRNEPSKLNSRANRNLSDNKFISYLGITDKYRRNILDNIIRQYEDSALSIDEGVLALSFALLRSNGFISRKWEINTNSKIDSLLSLWIVNTINPDIVKNFYNNTDIENMDDDFLGAFYQSIQSISQKSNRGSYYTPHHLLKGITVDTETKILDPCCGSGGILLKILSKEHNTKKIYARDIDELALKICFINLSLFFNTQNLDSYIQKQDIAFIDRNGLFLQENNERFDMIVTNPPWGSKFTKQQKDYLLKQYPELETTEIFSIALYNAINLLVSGGNLYFFLPHSFLNVVAHHNIRRIIFNSNKISIKLLGNAFKGVLSESILLHIQTKHNTQKNIFITDKNGNKYILHQKNITAPYYIVSATSKANDTEIIDQIYKAPHCDLGKDTIFALGIVTGNNVRHLNTQKTNKSEAIYRGKDITKYKFGDPQMFLVFHPELYQQVAPVEYYRQKKIAYRFISDKIICALDESNSLLLNSANLLISKNYPMETLVAVLNSDIYTFIFQKKFNSKKVLKSHILDMPLPILPPEIHKYILDLYIAAFTNDIELCDFQSKIDEIICSAFSLGKLQYNYIKDLVSRKFSSHKR